MCVSDMQMHMESFEETILSKSGNAASWMEGKRPDFSGWMMVGEEKTPWPQRQVTKLADANWVDVTMWDEFAPYIREGDIVVNCLRSQAQRGWYKWSSKCSTMGKKPYLHRTSPSTMRCHGLKTHSSSQETTCLQNSKHPRPHHQITFEARCPPVQPQDPVRVCPPRWARLCDEHLQPSHEQPRGLQRGCHGKQACTKGTKAISQLQIHL